MSPVPSSSYVETKLAPGLIERVYPSGKTVFRSYAYAGGLQDLATWEGLNRTEAKAKHKQHALDFAGRKTSRSDVQTLEQAMHEAFDYLAAEVERGAFASGTLDGYRTHWRLRIATHPIAKRKLSQIDKTLCLHWLRSLRSTGASYTQHGAVTTLRTVLRIARESDFMAHDPFLGIPRKEFPAQRPETPTVALSNEESLRLLTALDSDEFRKATDTEYAHIVTVARYEGPRSSEVCGLFWRDVDFIEDRIALVGQQQRGQRVTVPVVKLDPKNGEHGKRSPRMFPQTREALYAQLEVELAKGLGRPDDPCFTQANGRPITRKHLLAAVKRAAKIADVEATTKQLRTSFLTGAAHAGIPAVEISTRSGNSPAVIERFYVKPIRTIEQEQENIDRMLANGFAGELTVKEAA